MNKHHDNLLVGYFDIEKMQKLVAKKYSSKILHHNIKIYVRSCNVYLVFKIARHKPYGNLQ